MLTPRLKENEDELEMQNGVMVRRADWAEAYAAQEAKLAPARAAKAALAKTDSQMTYNEERALTLANPGKDKLTQWEKDTIADKAAKRQAYLDELAKLSAEEQNLI